MEDLISVTVNITSAIYFAGIVNGYRTSVFDTSRLNSEKTNSTYEIEKRRLFLFILELFLIFIYPFLFQFGTKYFLCAKAHI